MPWFMEDGQPMFICHPENIRHQEQSILQGVRSIVENGIIAEARGKPWAVASKGNAPPYQLISFGTISRAMYRAVEEHGKNPNVQVPQLATWIEICNILSRYVYAAHIVMSYCSSAQRTYLGTAYHDTKHRQAGAARQGLFALRAAGTYGSRCFGCACLNAV